MFVQSGIISVRRQAVLFRLVIVQLEVNTRTILMLVPVVLLMGPVYAALMGARVAVGLLPAAACIVAWEYTRQTAHDEDLSGAWAFARTLPITPGQIVSARYLAGLMVFLGHGLVALSVAVAMPSLRRAVPPGAWPVAMGMTIGIGLVLIAVCNWIYYRYGYRTLATGLGYLAVPLAVVFLILASPLGRSAPFVTFFRRIAWLGQWSLAHPLPAVAIWMAMACSILGISWRQAIAAFSRREF